MRFLLFLLIAKDPSAKELLDKVDRMFRRDQTTALITMNIITPKWERELKIKLYSLGMTKTLIEILSPKKDSGITTLKIDHEMWNYLPKSDKVLKIAPSMMMGSWMGSDFTNDDLVRDVSLVEEYDVSMITNNAHYLLTLIPHKTTATVWGKIEIFIDKISEVPTTQIYYDEANKEMRRIVLNDIKEIDGFKVPTIVEVASTNKAGHKTTITYNELSFKDMVSEDLFSLRRLQKR